MKRFIAILVAIGALIPLKNAFAQSPPLLNSPSDGATGVSQTPSLSWTSSASFLSYKAQISTNGWWEGTDLVWQGFNLTGSSTTVPTQKAEVEGLSKSPILETYEGGNPGAAKSDTVILFLRGRHDKTGTYQISAYGAIEAPSAKQAIIEFLAKPGPKRL
jgi:hypothetical protein